MVGDLEPGGREQGLDFAVDQILELRAGIEVGDDAATRTHKVVMVTLRELLRQLVTIAAAGTRHAHDHTGVNKLSQDPVCGRRGHSRAGHYLLDGERTRCVLQRSENGAAVLRQSQLARRQRLQGGRLGRCRERRS